ncbi:MAG TPA: hypothetical protein DCL77_00855 [Prolixibacteraceae bacterium]|jgi:hypothetical protein|nr:hypothetical protein [Prolixibacteraceae bacterium]
MEEERIPIDSVDFSCQINGKLVTLHSPLQGSGEKVFLQRIYRIKNSSKDSTLVGYEQSFQNDSIQLTIGYRKIVLADTTYRLGGTSGETFKDQIYATGSYIYQCEDPEWGHSSPTSQNAGFYITIKKMNEGVTYTSYLNQITELSVTQFNEFKADNSCQITKSMALNSGIYADYRNAFYIESTFECKLYENGMQTNHSIRLSKGSYKGVL